MNYPHWQYFLAICDDTEKLSRYVEFDANNFKTYSVEFVRLYLTLGSEVDVIGKQICLNLNSSSTADNINAYRKAIVAKFPDLPTVKVNFPRHSFSLTPWQDWANGKNPSWWGSYNKVKHERHVSFNRANLENTLSALAGVYVLVGYLYGNELASHKLKPNPDLVRFDGKYCLSSRTKMDSSYVLPGVPKPTR